MNNQILNDQTVIYYVVRVNGRNVSDRLNSPMLAEMEKSKLDPEMRAVAEVVTVTANGAQVLLG